MKTKTEHGITDLNGKQEETSGYTGTRTHGKNQTLSVSKECWPLRIAQTKQEVSLPKKIVTFLGFHCVPGWTKNFKKTARELEEIKSSEKLVEVPLHHSMRIWKQKIFLRRGSLLIWDSRLPHGRLGNSQLIALGSYPSTSDKWRIVQYISFFEEEKEDYKREKRVQLFEERAAKYEVKLTELGEKLLGRKPWPEAH